MNGAIEEIKKICGKKPEMIMIVDVLATLADRLTKAEQEIQVLREGKNNGSKKESGLNIG